ncbi:hypothetical protein MUK42_36338 [Musa troglodytarum]|uniref:Uncharacterized protein n=1 Tax=Musa troglodytarum TaxID=320322 RepID=A0A9E7KBM3_9LILI|nr:hypothetical protein MUK42_36338 [Musa troglodytarum]
MLSACEKKETRERINFVDHNGINSDHKSPSDIGQERQTHVRCSWPPPESKHAPTAPLHVARPRFPPSTWRSSDLPDQFSTHAQLSHPSGYPTGDCQNNCGRVGVKRVWIRKAGTLRVPLEETSDFEPGPARLRCSAVFGPERRVSASAEVGTLGEWATPLAGEPWWRTNSRAAGGSSASCHCRVLPLLLRPSANLMDLPRLRLIAFLLFSLLLFLLRQSGCSIIMWLRGSLTRRPFFYVILIQKDVIFS